jgi:hypothetical protein
MVSARNCAACGKSQYRKKVWSKFKSKVICMICGQEYAFWIDGSIYSKSKGPTDKQKAMLKGAKIHGQDNAA